MNLYDPFINFIIFDKIIFIILSIIILYYKRINKTKKDKNIDELILFLEFFKERTEFIFIISMSILILILFRSNGTLEINNHLRLLFLAYGIIIIFTADWNLFIQESPFFTYFKNIFV